MMRNLTPTRCIYLAAAAAVLCLVAATFQLEARKNGVEIELEGSVLGGGMFCATEGCHDIFSNSTFNMVGSADFQGLPESYQGGEVVDFDLKISGAASSKVFGFELASLFEDGTQAGTLVPLTAGVKSHLLEGVSLLLHSPAPLKSGTVRFRWFAPPPPATRNVLFKVAANAANDNDDPSGDHINTKEAQVKVAAPPPALEESIFAQVGDGQIEDIRFQTTLILVNTGSDSAVELDFIDSSGQPFAVDLGALGMGSSFQFSLQGGESISAQTPGTGDLKVGYARLRAGEGLGGTAVFTRSAVGSGVALFETGVPAAKPLLEFSVFADQVGPRRTGLALVNPSQGTATITLRLFDKEFVEQAPAFQFTLEPGHHRARFIDEFFPSQSGLDEGVLTVASDQAIAAVTLRQDEDGTPFPQKVPLLTAFPVIPGRFVP